jgi:transposase
VSLRIHGSNATAKDVHTCLQDADHRDDVRWVRRLRVLLDRRLHQTAGSVLGARWGLSPSCLSAWPKACLLRGLERVVSHHGGGRPPPVTPQQRQRCVEVMEAGPLVGGVETACGHSVLIRVLIWRALGVLYHRHSGGPLVHNLGCAFHKARGGLGPSRRGQAPGLAAGQRAGALPDGPAVQRAAPLCRGSQGCPVGLAALHGGAAGAPAGGPHAWHAHRLYGMWRHGVVRWALVLSGHRRAVPRRKCPSVSGEAHGPNDRPIGFHA